MFFFSQNFEFSETLIILEVSNIEVFIFHKLQVNFFLNLHKTLGLM